jgi:hypothetical protein
MHFLAAVEAAKVRRIVRDQDVPVVDGAARHHMILRAGQAQPANVVRLGKSSFPRQFCQLGA